MAADSPEAGAPVGFVRRIVRGVRDSASLPARRRELLRTAFAGDGIEKALVRDVVRSLSVQTIVETGTYIGKTSYWLGVTFPDIPVLTCEVLPEMHVVARRHLRGRRNVLPVLADSAVWLERLVGDMKGPALFFLDAHGMSSDWLKQSPLRREIAAVLSRDAPSVVIVDDFKVPGRADYAFSVAETGSSFAFPEETRLELANALDLSVIEDLLSSPDRVLYPSYTYEDALRFQADPMHGNLIGYVVILHAVPAADMQSFLDNELLTRFYQRGQ